MDASKNSPLHIAVIYSNDIETIKLLMESGSSVNQKNKDSHSPIHTAAYLGKEKLVDQLLKAKDANIHLQDSEGYTAIHLSILKRKMAATKAILRYMDEKNTSTVLTSTNGTTPLHIACYLGLILFFKLKK